MNRPTPQQFAQCIFALSMAERGRDLVFAPQPASASQVSFARMWACDIAPVCAALERMSSVGLRIVEAVEPAVEVLR